MNLEGCSRKGFDISEKPKTVKKGFNLELDNLVEMDQRMLTTPNIAHIGRIFVIITHEPTEAPCVVIPDQASANQ